MVGTKGKENETSREVEAGERATTGHAEGCKLLLIALSMALTGVGASLAYKKCDE